MPGATLLSQAGSELGDGEDGVISAHHLASSAQRVLALATTPPKGTQRECWMMVQRLAHGELNKCLEYASRPELAQRVAKRGAYQVGCWLDHQQIPDTLNTNLIKLRPANREPFPPRGTWASVDKLMETVESNADKLFQELLTVTGGKLHHSDKLAEHYHGIQVLLDHNGEHVAHDNRPHQNWGRWYMAKVSHGSIPASC